MAKKSKAKKRAAIKKAARKRVEPRASKHEIVVRVQQQAPLGMIPTTTDLAEPMKDGNKLTVTKTWMSDMQIIKMVQRTPRAHVYERKGKGGQKFTYVTGAYVEKVLNFVFGWNWDFEIVQHGREGAFLWVHGKLTVRSPRGDQAIVKSQFGRAEIKMLRDGKGMVDFGNDLKAAATDSLKKCASLLGIASDIYGKTEYKAESGNEPRDDQAPQLPPAPPQGPPADGPVEELYCHGSGKSGCPEGNELTRPEWDYSIKHFGKPLCRSCQVHARPITKK